MHEDDRIEMQIWKLQNDEEVEMTADQVYARARAHERNNLRVFWGMAVVTPLAVAAYIYNLLHFQDPWLIAGTAWALGAFGYFVWISVRNRNGKKPEPEPGVEFLRRLFKRKRQWALDMRWAVLLSVPAILAVWWGGGPVLRAKALGVKSPAVLDFLGGPGPLIVMALVLGLVWFAVREEARRLTREIQKLDGMIS